MTHTHTHTHTHDTHVCAHSPCLLPCQQYVDQRPGFVAWVRVVDTPACPMHPMDWCSGKAHAQPQCARCVTRVSHACCFVNMSLVFGACDVLREASYAALQGSLLCVCVCVCACVCVCCTACYPLQKKQKYLMTLASTLNIDGSAGATKYDSVRCVWHTHTHTHTSTHTYTHQACHQLKLRDVTTVSQACGTGKRMYCNMVCCVYVCVCGCFCAASGPVYVVCMCVCVCVYACVCTDLPRSEW